MEEKRNSESVNYYRDRGEFSIYLPLSVSKQASKQSSFLLSFLDDDVLNLKDLEKNILVPQGSTRQAHSCMLP